MITREQRLASSPSHRSQDACRQSTARPGGVKISTVAFILSLDQGTTSSRAIVFDHDGAVKATAQREFRQIFPQPGWVEHDPTEIWATQSGVLHEALVKAGITARDIVAIGITNQRETTVVWERATGKPIANAIVWQDRRTAPICDTLRRAGYGATF